MLYLRRVKPLNCYVTMTGKLFRTCLIITLHILLCGFPSLLGAEVAVKDGIIPRPAEISFKSGVFGYDGTRGKFRIRLVSGGSPESYTLKVTPDSVLIEASDSAGVFYAMQTIGFLADTAAG